MENQFFLMNLPPNVIVEILARLPAKSIIQSKSVCKTFLDLITNPHFTNLHSSLSKHALIIHHTETFKNYFALIDFERSHTRPRHHPSRQITFKFSNLTDHQDSNIVIDGSVDGFLLLRDINYKHETLYVCNPITREFHRLPRHDGEIIYPMAVTHGFGLTRKTEEYKVVRITHQRELNPINRLCVRVPFSNCQVFSFKTGAWKTIGGAPFVYDSRLIGVFLEGNIHWLIQDLEGSELISCFDLENEVFAPFPGPFPGRRIWGSLGILQNCLSLMDNTSFSDIDIWVMKEYGVEKSWSKEIVIRKMPELVGPSFQIVYGLEVFEDGSVLIVWGDHFMVCYCSKSGVFEEVDLDQARGPNSIEAIHYVPSFTSLERVVKRDVCTF